MWREEVSSGGGSESGRGLRPVANLSLFDLLDEDVECPVENGRQVPVRNPVPE